MVAEARPLARKKLKRLDALVIAALVKIVLHSIRSLDDSGLAGSHRADWGCFIFIHCSHDRRQPVGPSHGPRIRQSKGRWSYIVEGGEAFGVTEVAQWPSHVVFCRAFPTKFLQILEKPTWSPPGDFERISAPIRGDLPHISATLIRVNGTLMSRSEAAIFDRKIFDLPCRPMDPSNDTERLTNSTMHHHVVTRPQCRLGKLNSRSR